jgi:WD40 repeat protein
MLTTHFALGGMKSAYLWDLKTGRRTELGPHAGYVSAGFGPDGKRAWTTSDATVHLWDAQTGRPLRTFGGHERTIHAVGISNAGTRLVSIDYDGVARLWDVQSGKLLGTLPDRLGPNRIHSLVFAPNDRRVLADKCSAFPPRLVGNRGPARVWDVNSRQVAFVLNESDENKVGKFQTVHGEQHFAVFSSDARLILTGSTNGLARIWDGKTGEERAVLRGHESGVEWGAFSPDGTRAATASRDGSVRVWDVETGREVRTLSGHEAGVQWVDWGRDGQSLVSAAKDGTVRLWDAATGAATGMVRVGRGREVFAAFVGNGERVLISRDGTARLAPADALAEAYRRKPRELTQAERRRFEVPR